MAEVTVIYLPPITPPIGGYRLTLTPDEFEAVKTCLGRQTTQAGREGGFRRENTHSVYAAMDSAE